MILKMLRIINNMLKFHNNDDFENVTYYK